MKKDFSENEKLIKQLRKGNELAFSHLVDTYHHPLCVYAFSLSRDHEKAEDMVQNVFLRTWEQRAQLKPGFSIKKFLYRSVYNEFIDQYRKNQAVRLLEKKYADALDSLIEEDENALFKLIAAVKNEIENLPDKCKQIFQLSKKEGLTNSEIAQYLGVSIKTVEAQITKAFTQIRKRIGNKIPGLLLVPVVSEVFLMLKTGPVF